MWVPSLTTLMKYLSMPVDLRSIWVTPSRGLACKRRATRGQLRVWLPRRHDLKQGRVGAREVGTQGRQNSNKRLACPGNGGPKRSVWMTWLTLSLEASGCSCDRAEAARQAGRQGRSCSRGLRRTAWWRKRSSLGRPAPPQRCRGAGAALAGQCQAERWTAQLQSPLNPPPS